MIDVVVTGIPMDFPDCKKYNRETLKVACKVAKRIGANAIILTKENLLETLKWPPEKLNGKTFIEPGQMSRSSKTMTKLNKLFCYFLTIHRKIECNFVIIVGDYDRLDKRVKYYWDRMERWRG